MKLKFNGKLLKSHMKAKRLVDTKNNISISMAQVGKATGIGRSTIMRAERGMNLDTETLANICSWLETPMETYFTKSKSIK